MKSIQINDLICFSNLGTALAGQPARRPDGLYRCLEDSTDKMLYVPMGRASQNTLATRVHANNLANISTSGFCRGFEQVRSTQVFGDSFPARIFAMSERPGTDFSHGSLQEIGNELNIAIDGGSFVAVQAPDGSETYVRTVSMHIDALGMLRTGDGLSVLDNGGPIAVPPKEEVEIDQDGTISTHTLDENPSVVIVVDRIKPVSPNLRQMEKGTDSLLHYKPQPGEQVSLVDANVKMVLSFLESGSMNTIEEMTVILLLSRQFELYMKMMHTAEDDSAAVVRTLQIS